ncbi:DgyrCDS4733 [Dimorphilus gyrociliatus]|uniref:DgyrCDS4733 n=1 Tax=Dimorphilus gyrociliatus TaxID=2664684 RepID=A0A7I8VHM4_9ANNE|nr:DgyrCDS4733 [Dimorphilus gyrociliatus]
MALQEDDEKKLSEIFDIVYKNYIFCETTNESSSSVIVQKKVKESFEICEKLVAMVNSLELFSKNERLEEISTSDIKMMMLPAFMGYYRGKVTKDDRMSVLKESQIFFIDFLKLAKLYGIASIDLPNVGEENVSELENSKTQTENLVEMSNIRAKKIERHREKVKLKEKLNELRSAIDKPSADEEIVRDFYITQLKEWVSLSYEELDNIDRELEIFNFMKNRSASDSSEVGTKPKEQPKKPLRPFILTKSAVQAAVFGAGYPSLPTYTLEEFYEEQFANGNVPPAKYICYKQLS